MCPGHASAPVPGPISADTETEQDPVGLLGMEAFQALVNQGREGVQRQGRASQKKPQHSFGGRALAQSQLMHITMSLSSSAELKPPAKGRC